VDFQKVHKHFNNLVNEYSCCDLEFVDCHTHKIHEIVMSLKERFHINVLSSGELL